MKNNALCFVSDTGYYQQTKHAILSAKKHNPEYKIILLSNGVVDDLVDIHISPQQLGLNLNFWVITGRTAIVKFALDHLKFDSCIFVDGDTYTYDSYVDMQKELDTSSILVIPHLLKPLPNDNLNPELKQIGLMGNYNTGIFAVSKRGNEFLNWWNHQTNFYPHLDPHNGYAAEQGWLRYALDFDENAKIFRHPGYNLAYWNIKQRKIDFKENNWYVDGKKMCIMHFSGFKKDTPISRMSIHQNRYNLSVDDLEYKIFEDYKKLIWG